MNEYLLPTIKLLFFSDRKVSLNFSLRDLFLSGLYGKDFNILVNGEQLNLNEIVFFEKIFLGEEVFSLDLEPFQSVVISFTPKVNERLLEKFLMNKENYLFTNENLEFKLNDIKYKYQNLGFVLEFETTSILPIYMFILDKFIGAIKVKEVE